MSGIDCIAVEGVTRTFGPTLALRGVSCRFEPGQISFLEGPNGAGKTTLLSILATVLSPSSGSVTFAPFGENRDAARAHLGWVAHESHCYPDLTGRQNVELAAELHGVDGPSAAWVAVRERVGAERFGERPVSALSRGQKQRIALARALVHRPSVLLLDEPSSGLDAASAQQLEEVLVEERDRGTIVIVASHSARLATRLGGRRVRLERGRLVADESARAKSDREASRESSA